MYVAEERVVADRRPGHHAPVSAAGHERDIALHGTRGPAIMRQRISGGGRMSIKSWPKPRTGESRERLCAIPRASGKYSSTYWWGLIKKAIRYDRLVCCEICEVFELDLSDYSHLSPYLHVHHLHYDSIGAECPEDVMLLCSDCHEMIHRIERKS